MDNPKSRASRNKERKNYYQAILVSREVAQQIVAIAKKEFRTLAGQVEFVLAKYLEDKNNSGPTP